MIGGASNISLFLLGALGSVWPTIGALHKLPSGYETSLTKLEYCFDRMDDLDNKTIDIMFHGVLPNHVTPLVRSKLRQWGLPDAEAGTGDA